MRAVILVAYLLLGLIGAIWFVWRSSKRSNVTGGDLLFAFLSIAAGPATVIILLLMSFEGWWVRHNLGSRVIFKARN